MQNPFAMASSQVKFNADAILEYAKQTGGIEKLGNGHIRNLCGVCVCVHASARG